MFPPRWEGTFPGWLVELQLTALGEGNHPVVRAETLFSADPEQCCVKRCQTTRITTGQNPTDLSWFVQRVNIHGCEGPDIRQDEIFNALRKVRC